MSSNNPKLVPVDDTNAPPSSKVKGSQLIDLAKDDVPEPHQPQAKSKKSSAVTEDEKQVMDTNASPSKVKGSQLVDLAKDDVPEPHQLRAKSKKKSAVTDEERQILAAPPPFGPVDDGSKTPPPPEIISLATYMERRRRSTAEEKRPVPPETGSKGVLPLEKRFRFAHDLGLFTTTLAEVVQRDIKREAEAEADEWFKNLAIEKAAEEEEAKRQAAEKEAAAEREAAECAERRHDVWNADNIEDRVALPEVARYESTVISDKLAPHLTSSSSTKSSSKNTRTPKSTPPKPGDGKAKAVESSPKNPARVTKTPQSSQSSQSSGKKSGIRMSCSAALRGLMDNVEKNQAKEEKAKKEKEQEMKNKKKQAVSAAGIAKKAVPKTRLPAAAPAVVKEVAKKAVPELISSALPPGVQRALGKSSSATPSGTYSQRTSARTSTPASSIATGPWRRWRDVSPKSRPRATAAQAMEEAGIRETPEGLRIVNKFHYLKPLGTPLYEPPPLAVRKIKIPKKKAPPPRPEEKISNRLCRAHDVDIFPMNILHPSKLRKRDDNDDDDGSDSDSRAAKRIKTAPVIRRRQITPEPTGPNVQERETRAGREAALKRVIAIHEAKKRRRYLANRYH
ncbi:MAG: hypothetical protein M1815_005350 [Lichina confinis]|nr:MAG: hypothetical protein M1815_005350 [Lichina confinis]